MTKNIKKKNLTHTKTIKPDKSKETLNNIGPYKVLEVIGKGGMGTVYLAQQERPIRRKVAIKVIKPGMDSKEVIARFESEQQALALMNHPNIAQVHDSGETEQGYPYFVMEYVPGKPITEYCDKNKMKTEERLRLFEQVCDAMQHAHFKGIVHRDLKPSNILITFQDNKHIPKIIDFGIAKALTGQGLTEKTLHTVHGVAIGTPVYMSPEQAELTGYDIDTRTDVYSLGVLLYELLIGVSPFEEEQLEKAGLMEIFRIIREVEPPRPSTRFSSLGDTSTDIAKRRGTNIIGLSKQLKGDLDWIVMKAVEKDRKRRYNSAAELANDVERYLIQEPIQARPPTIAYKVRKYIRRHKTVSVAVISIFFLVVAFSVWNILERQKSEKSLKEANYNFALALKEKAKKYSNENRWNLVKLFCLNSLLYQTKAQKYIPMGDIELPTGYQDWRLSNKNTSVDIGIDVWSLNPEWTYLASSGLSSEKIMISEVSTGEVIGTMVGHKKPIRALSFSPDGKSIASASFDRSIKIWDFASRKETATLTRNSTPGKLIFFPDGEKLIAAYQDGVIKIWQISDSEEIWSCKAHDKRISVLSLGPKGKYLASCSGDNTIKIWDISSKDQNAYIKFQSESVIALCFSSDGKFLASGEMGGTIKIWEIDNGKAIATLKKDSFNILSLDFSPDGKYLVSGSAGQRIYIWDLSKEDVISTLGGTRAIFHPNGQYLATHDMHSDEFLIWEVSAARNIVSLEGHDESVNTIRLSPDGNYMASGSSDNTIKLWDIHNRKELQILKGHDSPITTIRFSPDGYLLASGSDDATVIIWELPHGNLRAKLKGNYDRINSLAFSPDRKFLASGNRMPRPESLTREKGIAGLKIWDVERGEEKISLKTFILCVDALKFSEDGKYLNAKIGDGSIIVWDISNGEEIETIKFSHGSGGLACFSPDGKYCADGGWGYEKIARIWEMSSGRMIASLKGHTEGISAINFSYDGKYLATGSGDLTIKLWEVQTGRLIVTLKGHLDRVRSVSFTPDGKHLVSGSRDKTIKIWDLDYFLNYLWLGFDYPLKEKEVNKLLKKIEKEVGFKMDGITPVNSRFYLDLASDYIDKREYEMATNAYQKAIDIEPNSVRALNGLGWIYYLESNYDDAMNNFKKAIEMNKWNFHVHFNMALTYLAKNDFDGAYNYYVFIAEELEPDFFEFERGIEDIDELIKNKPELAFCFLIRGYLYIKGAERQKAIWGFESPEEKKKAKGDLNRFINDFEGKEEWKELARKLLNEIENHRNDGLEKMSRTSNKL